MARGRSFSLALKCLVPVFLLIVSTPSLAQMERRVALIVGNANYRHVGALDNPGNDARLIATTLSSLGFALVGEGPVLDADKPAFDRVVQEFGRRIQGADVALFYYAGHGIQVRGSNYLVPVDANPVRETDVDFQMLDSALVLRQMGASGARLNIVMLDACRNNPFAARGLRMVQRGLAQMQAPEGTLISYATQPDNVALDGADGHSPYTRAVSEVVRRPGLGIFRTFNDVGLVVKRLTGGAQQPWVSSSPIAGDFYFAGPSSAIAAVQPDTPVKSLSTLDATPSPLQPPVPSQVSETDMKRIKEIGARKKIPLPAFSVRTAQGIAQSMRRFIGAWATEVGFNGRGRQAMVIITDVDNGGIASGFYAWGPAPSGTPAQLAGVAASYHPVSGPIVGNSITFDNKAYTLTVTLKADNSLDLVHKYQQGFVGMAIAKPLWRLATVVN